MSVGDGDTATYVDEEANDVDVVTGAGSDEDIKDEVEIEDDMEDEDEDVDVDLVTLRELVPVWLKPFCDDPHVGSAGLHQVTLTMLM